MEHREQYVRSGVLSEDFEWDTKIKSGGRKDQDAIPSTTTRSITTATR
jgi:hypothetical protein